MDNSNLNEQFLSHFIRVMEQRRPPEIEAFGVGGSLGKGESADKYSDIDFFILVNEADASKFMEAFYDFAALFGKPLLYRGPVHVPNYGYSFTVLYEPLIFCQFNVNSRHSLTPGPIRKYTRIIFDENGYYTDFTKTQSEERFNLATIFQSSCSLFWFRAVNVWRDVSRGQYWYAIRHMYDVRQQLFVLMRLKLNKHPADFNRFVEKNLEEDLGDDLCLSLAPALPHYEKDSISKALVFSVQRYKEEAPRLAQALGVDYPAAAADLISELVYRLLR